MKKTSVFLLVLICAFTMVSCGGPVFKPDEPEWAYASVTVYNQSDYDVADLYVEGHALGSLKNGEERDFDIQFAAPETRLDVEYRSDGKSFDVENDEGALHYNLLEFKRIRELDGISEIGLITDDPASLEKDIYYSPWLLKDGAKARIYIKNEGYKVEVIEGGTYSEIGVDDIFPPPVPQD